MRWITCQKISRFIRSKTGESIDCCPSCHGEDNLHVQEQKCIMQ